MRHNRTTGKMQPGHLFELRLLAALSQDNLAHTPQNRHSGQGARTTFLTQMQRHMRTKLDLVQLFQYYFLFFKGILL